MLQTKDTDWLDEYKNKIVHAMYKRPTSDRGTIKWADGKKLFHANWNQKKEEVTLLISNKMDLIRKTRERTLCNYQGLNPQEEDKTIVNIYMHTK